LLNDAEVNEVLKTYPEIVRDVTMEIIALEDDLEALHTKKGQLEKEVMVRLYREYPIMPVDNGTRDANEEIRKEEYYHATGTDILFRTLLQDIVDIQSRITNLRVSKDFHSSKLRATLALIER